jgi:hypothetical protein
MLVGQSPSRNERWLQRAAPDQKHSLSKYGGISLQYTYGKKVFHQTLVFISNSILFRSDVFVPVICTDRIDAQMKILCILPVQKWRGGTRIWEKRGSRALHGLCGLGTLQKPQKLVHTKKNAHVFCLGSCMSGPRYCTPGLFFLWNSPILANSVPS